MAKMFYTMEETKAALGRNEDAVKQLAKDGKLREFRDGPRLMFKADQVEQLKTELGGGGGEVGISDDAAPLSLASDSRAGSGTLSLSDSASGSRVVSKEDTQFADIGLSGSLGGVPSPRPGDSRSSSGTGVGSGSGILNLGGSGLTGSGLGSGGTRGGITVFDVDDSQKVDPSAQTAISGAGGKEQLNLEGVGSGSGLLDLSRASDDTSLGAVFDELTPGKGRKGGASSVAAAMESGMGVDMSSAPAERAARATLAAPILVEAPDPAGAAIGTAALAGAGVVTFGMFILGATLLGFRPSVMDDLVWTANGKMYMLLAMGVVIVFGIVGFIAQKFVAK